MWSIKLININELIYANIRTRILEAPYINLYQNMLQISVYILGLHISKIFTA